MKNKYLLLFWLSPLFIFAQTPTASFATWKDNRTAAYSIIHDDYSSWVTGIYQHADPIATARGVKLAFGAITSGCGTTEWTNANTMIGHGHECINHSHNHRCGGSASNCSGQTTYSSADFNVELDQSTNLIQTNTGKRPRFFIHPYDAVTVGDAPSTTIINYLTSIGYLGTRAGNQESVNTSNATNYMYLNFYVYDGTQSITSINSVVTNTIASGGYAIREFHGVADGSWGAMTVANYTNHLDFVKARIDNGTLWSATPTQVITYMKQRNAFQPVASYNASSGNIDVTFNTLQSLTASELAALNANMGASLTVNVNVSTLTQAFDVYQNNVLIPSIRNGNVVTFNAYPHQGNIELRCANGCVPSTDPVNIYNFAATAQTGSVTLNWTNPLTNFDDVMIVAQPVSSITTAPDLVTSYVADPDFLGAGTSFGSNGGKVVYFGKSNSVTVTGLTNGVLYYFKAFTKYNGAWSSGVAVNATPLAGPGPINVSNLVGTPAITTLQLAWVNPPAANRSQIMVVASLTPFTSAIPTGDGTAYTANANFTNVSSSIFDGGKVVYKSTGSSVNIIGLVGGTQYYYKVFTRLGTVWSSGVEGTRTTNAAPLPINVSNLTNTPAITTMRLTWVNPPAANRSQIMVVASLTPFTSAIPTGDGTAYTAGANFTNVSSSTFDGGKVVYKSTGTSVNMTGLVGSTQYYYKVFTRLGTVWSSGVEGIGTTNPAPQPINITNLTPTPAITSMRLTWVNPPSTNMTQIMTVFSLTPFTQQIPSGNGSAYTASANFTNTSSSAFDGGKVVSKTTNVTVNVTGLVAGTQYYYKVFTRLGTLWSLGVEGTASTLPNAVASVVNTNRDNTTMHPLSKIENSNEKDANIAFNDEKTTVVKAKTRDKYTLFPNPAAQYADIDLTAANGQIVEITIVSMIGQTMKKETVQSGLSLHRLNLEGLPNGQYFVRLQSADELLSVQKLMIMKK